MTVAGTALVDEPEDPPPVEPEVVAEPEPEPERRSGKVRDAQRARTSPPAGRAPAMSSELRAVQLAEDASLRDILDAIGTDGAYQIKVKRLEPMEAIDKTTGARLKVGGFLNTYLTPVDEEVLAKNHGGGRFEIRFMRKNAAGSFVFFKQRTIDIAGDPRTDDVFRTPQAAPQAPVAPPAPSESPSIVTKAFDMMQAQIVAAQNRPAAVAPVQDNRASDAMVQVLREQLAASNAEVAAMRAQLTVALTTKPPQDEFKDKLLGQLIDSESSKIAYLRAEFDKELSKLKEYNRDDIKRLEDRHDREIAAMREQHKRDLDFMRSSSEVNAVASKSLGDTSIQILNAQIRSLERDNDNLRDEVKELRAKKDKSIIEMVKEMDTIKEVLGGDEGEKSTFDKVAELVTSPAAGEFVQGIMGKREAAQQAAAQQTAIETKKKIVQSADGQRFIFDPKTGDLRPVKKKKVEPAAPQVTPDGMPVIPQETIDRMIGYLEKAFAGGQDPQIFAQSSMTMIPGEILAAIRDHGVDTFMAKVAKLPGTSPLTQQAGKNWVRKVGVALVGE